MRKCRVCGCTDHRACNPPCSWVEEDLCSGCVDIENKCHICGLHGDDHELVKCVDCGKMVCAENDSCVQHLGLSNEFPTCTKCISGYEMFDCTKCKLQNDDYPHADCPMEGFSIVYNCPEFVDINDPDNNEDE